MKKIRNIFLIISLSAFVLSMRSGAVTSVTSTWETKDTRAVLKALYIYNFARLTDWPEGYRGGSFDIGVIDDDNVYEQLQQKYKGKKIGRLSIKIKKTNLNELSNANFKVVYTNQSSNYINKVVTKLKSKSTLIVSNTDNGLRKGASINFVVDDNKQSYEISETNASKKNLVFSSKLVDLATASK